MNDTTDHPSPLLYAGVDISKDYLDLALGQRPLRYAHTAEGRRALLATLQQAAGRK